MVRIQILTAEKKRERGPAAMAYRGLRSAWNETKGFHCGDRVSAGRIKSNAPKTGSGRRKFVDRRKWMLTNLFQSVWKLAGQRNAAASSEPLSEGIHNVPLMIIGSVGLLRITLRKAQSLLFQPGRLPGLVINRNYDATPVRVRFGCLANFVMEFARFPVRKEDGTGWKLLSFDAFLKLKGHSFKPKFGVVELFAMRDTVVWDAGNRSYSFLAPPYVLSAANASVIFAALENGSQPHLYRNGIGKISAGAKVCLLRECPDDAKANKRKKAATKERLPANCLRVDGSCCAHALHLVITDSIDEEI